MIGIEYFILKALLTAVIATLLEAVSVKGLDNITVPIMVTVMTYLFYINRWGMNNKYENDDEVLLAKVEDKQRLANIKNKITYTDFLNDKEQVLINKKLNFKKNIYGLVKKTG